MKMFGRKGQATDPELGDARKTFEWPSQYKADKLFWQIPRNVQWNDNLIVREDEYAVFFRDGKALYVFQRPGRFALTTQNIPVLATLGARITGIRQLGEIYYIQKREMRGKFGTIEPLSFKDNEFGMVRIRAFGQFSYKVVDPLLFITQFIGIKGVSKEDEVVNWLKDQIIMVLNDVLGELKSIKNIGVLDVPAYLQEIETLTIARLTSLTKGYGLKVSKFAGLNINLPDEIKEAIDKKGIMTAYKVGYTEYQTGKAIEGIGKGAQKGGETAGFTGMGAGMGVGLAMAQALGEAMKGSGGGTTSKIICPHCGKAVDPEMTFCPYCGIRIKKEMSKCPNCGAVVDGEANFCPNCGAKLK